MNATSKTTAAIVVAAVTACTAADVGEPTVAPTVHVAKITFAETGLLEQRIALDLRFANPNPFEINAVAMRFGLDLGGTAFGKGTATGKITLPALDEVTVPVTVMVPTSNLIETIAGLSIDDRLGYALVGELLIDAVQPGGSGVVPFWGKDDLGVPQLRSLIEHLGTTTAERTVPDKHHG